LLALLQVSALSIFDYRERAAYCRQMADRAPTRQIKADWLRTAEVWLQMASESAVSTPDTVVGDVPGAADGAGAATAIH
jgi:hypothetical protein